MVFIKAILNKPDLKRKNKSRRQGDKQKCMVPSLCVLFDENIFLLKTHI